jgi:hypothetical protein
MTKRILVVEDHEDNRQIVRDMAYSRPTKLGRLLNIENHEAMVGTDASMAP